MVGSAGLPNSLPLSVLTSNHRMLILYVTCPLLRCLLSFLLVPFISFCKLDFYLFSFSLPRSLLALSLFSCCCSFLCTLTTHQSTHYFSIKSILLSQHSRAFICIQVSLQFFDWESDSIRQSRRHFSEGILRWSNVSISVYFSFSIVLLTICLNFLTVSVW